MNVPSIALFEQHPFTISSAPEDEKLTLHIQAKGDWTKTLEDKIRDMIIDAHVPELLDRSFVTSVLCSQIVMRSLWQC